MKFYLGALVVLLEVVLGLAASDAGNEKRSLRAARGLTRRKGKVLNACIGLYPGYNGQIGVMGKVKAEFGKMDDTVRFSYDLKGLSPGVSAGIHIHAGTSCDSPGDPMGHYWNNAVVTPDPWTTTYSSDEMGKSRGSFHIGDGYDYDAHIGHAVVIHDGDGRIGCGVLVEKNVKCSAPTQLTACIDPYPGYDGGSGDPTGRVSVKFKRRKLSMQYDLKGLEYSVEGGIHIHSGTSCENPDDPEGHYWNDAIVRSDPWTTTYESDRDGEVSGKFKLRDGYNYAQHVGHAVVIHARDGSVRTGCGILVEGKQHCTP